MEIKQHVEVEEFIGQEKSIEFKITQESMQMIMTALINLYSNPIGSIVREITANGIDAHIERDYVKSGRFEQGNVKFEYLSNYKDIEIEIQEENILFGVGHGFVVRDFGIGLSKERVEEVFTTFGASTKRKSNLEIGGFGLGCKAPLTYTDTFYVTAIYEGLKSVYMISKNNNGPTMDLIDESSVLDQLNSTEIFIPIKNEQDKYKFIEEIENQLYHIENIRYKNVNPETFKDSKTNYTFPHAYISDRNAPYLVMGGICYELNQSQVVFPWNYDIGLGLRFEIGDLDLIPSREAVMYTPNTINKIKIRIKELQEYCESKANTEDIIKFNSFILAGKFINTLYNNNDWDDVKSTLNSVYSYLADKRIEEKDILINDYSVKDYQTTLSLMNFMKISKNTFKSIANINNIKEEYFSGEYLFKQFSTYSFNYSILNSNRIKIVDEKLVATYSNIYLLRDVDYDLAVHSYIMRTKEKNDNIHDLETSIHNTLPKETFDILRSNILKELDTPIDYQDFHKKIKAVIAAHKKDLAIKYLRFKDYTQVEFKISTMETEKALELLGEAEVIYGFSEDDKLLRQVGKALLIDEYVDSSLFNLKINDRFNIIKIAESAEKFFTNGIYVQELFNMKYEKIRKWYTAHIIQENLSKCKFLHNFKAFNSEMSLLYEELSFYSNKYKNVTRVEKELLELCQDFKLEITEEIDKLNIILEYCKNLELFNEINYFTDSSYINNIQKFNERILDYLAFKQKETTFSPEIPQSSEEEKEDEELEETTY